MSFSIDQIKSAVIAELNGDLATLDQLWTHMARWWCIHYKRPFRDPMVLDYTLEELVKEYLIVQFMENPDRLREEITKSGGKTKEEQEDDNWFRRMESKYGVQRVSIDEQKRIIAEGEQAIQNETSDDDSPTLSDQPTQESTDQGEISLNWDTFKDK